jgi:integrase/recombinase XerC/integrase/recombinase XerD
VISLWTPKFKRFERTYFKEQCGAMTEYANSQNRASVWVTLNQIESLRSACYRAGAGYLQQRNEGIIVTMYDTGVCVRKLIQLGVEFLRNNKSELYLPAEVQKDHHNENSPPPAHSNLPTTPHGHYQPTNRLKDALALSSLT